MLKWKQTVVCRWHILESQRKLNCSAIRSRVRFLLNSHRVTTDFQGITASDFWHSTERPSFQKSWFDWRFKLWPSVGTMCDRQLRGWADSTLSDSFIADGDFVTATNTLRPTIHWTFVAITASISYLKPGHPYLDIISQILSYIYQNNFRCNLDQSGKQRNRLNRMSKF